MGKESIRTLKNINYNSKKNSKNSKKSKKNKNNDDPTTSEEMMRILDSDSEVMNKPSVKDFLSKNNKLTPYNGELQEPQQFNGMQGMNMQNMGMQNMGIQNMGMQNMGMQGMGMQNQMMGMQNQLQMFSPSNYDPLMLQQIAPLQTAQAMAEGRPSNLLTPNAMGNSLAGFARSGFDLPTGPSMIGGGYLRKLK